MEAAISLKGWQTSTIPYGMAVHKSADFIMLCTSCIPHLVNYSSLKLS